MTGCCGARRQGSSIQDYFQRGLATRRLPELACPGPVVEGLGLWAGYSLELRAGRIAEARFRCAACTTLVAYCQALAEHLQGLTPTEAGAAQAADLVSLARGIPASHRDRAVLAVAALRGALAALSDSFQPATEVCR